MDTKEKVKRTRVRAYPLEFKVRVLAQCEEPGASVAKVALAHGLNANMLHTWRRQAHPSLQRLAPCTGEFVSVPLPDASTPAAARRFASSFAVVQHRSL